MNKSSKTQEKIEKFIFNSVVITTQQFDYESQNWMHLNILTTYITGKIQGKFQDHNFSAKISPNDSLKSTYYCKY